MTYAIKTIEDMEKLYYSRAGQDFLRQNDLNAPFIRKSDEPVLTTTTGVYNAVYGVQAWVQLNQEANTVGAFPKSVWTQSGWRAITARSQSLGYGGTAEAGSLPETSKPTFAEVSTKPKTSVVTFESSEVQEFLAKSKDDAFGTLQDLRTYFAVEHKEDLNAQLNTQNGTLAAYNFESMDRVVSSYAEVTNCPESDESTSYTTNDVDIYSIDRDSSAGWSDAYVGHNSGTVRSLTDSLLQALVQNTLTNGANEGGQWFQTGYSTWSVINQLYDPQVRYNIIGSQKAKGSVNGIQTVEGNGAGFKVNTLFGNPVIISKNTVVDTGGIARIYELDTSNPEGFDLPRLSLRIAKPTQYFEAGMSAGNPFAIDKLADQGMYRTMGETVCTFFGAQGKLRDLKS